MTIFSRMEISHISTSAIAGRQWELYLIYMIAFIVNRFLLDFKREFSYSSVYRVWETIWAARKVVSPHFYLFVALGLVETYRDIIIDR